MTKLKEKIIVIDFKQQKENTKYDKAKKSSTILISVILTKTG